MESFDAREVWMVESVKYLCAERRYKDVVAMTPVSVEWASQVKESFFRGACEMLRMLSTAAQHLGEADKAISLLEQRARLVVAAGACISPATRGVR
jgi:hypothetical protein